MTTSRTRQRYDAIYEAIRERISLLDYPPGARLSEEALAEEFGVSRTPLRRVLARLESEGLLRSVQSVGTIVTDVDVETLTQAYRLRMELAGMIGRIDPVPVSAAIVDPLEACRRQLDGMGSTPTVRAFAAINIAFFHALKALTLNEPYREICEQLYYRTARIWIKSIDAKDMDNEIEIFRREVTDILEAVEIGDLEAVGFIRRAHISMSFQRLKARQAPTQT